MLKNTKRIRIDDAMTAKGNYCATFDYLKNCWKLLEDHYVSKEPPKTGDPQRARIAPRVWMVTFNINIVDGFSSKSLRSILDCRDVFPISNLIADEANLNYYLQIAQCQILQLSMSLLQMIVLYQFSKNFNLI